MIALFADPAVFALAAGLFATMAARGTPLPFVPSPKNFYSCSGAVARAASAPLDPMPALTDDGRELADEITALMTCGVSAIGTDSVCPTPDGRYSDIWSETDVAGLSPAPNANVTAEPSIQALEASASDCLSGAYTVDPAPAANGAKLAAALDSGMAIYIGFSCGSAFQALVAGQVAQPTPASDATAGGHSIVIVSYRINAAGEYEWRARNSWGATFADSGDVWCSDSWRMALWEAWALNETMLNAVVAKEAA